MSERLTDDQVAWYAGTSRTAKWTADMAVHENIVTLAREVQAHRSSCECAPLCIAGGHSAPCSDCSLMIEAAEALEKINAQHGGPDVELVTGAIDVAHLERQREWSARTFGPGARTAGVIDHITKELDEVAADPADVLEWADLLILAFDGALRAGHEPAAIIAAIKAKQSVNEGRVWPDWRTADPDKAIEHIR